MAGQTLQDQVKLDESRLFVYFKAASEGIVGDEKQNLQHCSNTRHN